MSSRINLTEKDIKFIKSKFPNAILDNEKFSKYNIQTGGFGNQEIVTRNKITIVKPKAVRVSITRYYGHYDYKYTYTYRKFTKYGAWVYHNHTYGRDLKLGLGEVKDVLNKSRSIGTVQHHPKKQKPRLQECCHNFAPDMEHYEIKDGVYTLQNTIWDAELGRILTVNPETLELTECDIAKPDQDVWYEVYLNLITDKDHTLTILYNGEQFTAYKSLGYWSGPDRNKYTTREVVSKTFYQNFDPKWLTISMKAVIDKLIAETHT